MGCLQSTASEANRNREIDEAAQLDASRLENEVKLLLLGSGESGKSTFRKQMKIIHKNGFTDAECVEYRKIVYNNIISAFQILVREATKAGEIVDSRGILDLNASKYQYSPADGENFIKLWADPIIKKHFAFHGKYQIPDSVSFLLRDLERICKEGYVPTHSDILHCRIQTTGIVEVIFDYGGIQFRLVDVGGQRSERRKWIHCFQDVTAVLFVVNLAEYDLFLREDNETNRMQESLYLFDEICNSKWFADTSIILFLNKTDLFMEKIKTVPMNKCFPGYTGGSDYGLAREYVAQQFRALNRSSSKQVFTHFTCATETKNVEVVFADVKEVIVNKYLHSGAV